MVGLLAECRSKVLAVSIAAIFGVGLLGSNTSHALEAFDGRIQVHGFGEMQIRALDEKFEQQLDLAQWYNVVNIELELDILPDGWGPIDLMSAYVRVEGRYDCVYRHGCNDVIGALPNLVQLARGKDSVDVFDSMDTYGDRASRVPDRLADAEFEDFGGVIEAGPRVAVNPNNEILSMNGDRYIGIETFPEIECNNVRVSTPVCPDDAMGNPVAGIPTGRAIVSKGAQDVEVGEIVDRDPALLALFGFTPINGEIIDDRGFLPGLLDARGADDLPGTADDPYRYTMEPFLDFALNFRNVRNFDGGRVATMGPWLPKNFIESIGSLRHKANPFRGRAAPSAGLELVNGEIRALPGFLRYHTADQVVNLNRLGFNPFIATDRPDVRITVTDATGTPLARFINENPLRGLPTQLDLEPFVNPLAPGGYEISSTQYNELLAEAEARVDTFPDELLEFLPPNILGQRQSGLINPNTGQLGNFTLVPPIENFLPINGGRTLTNTVILTDRESIQDPNFGLTDPFGGDYSGIVPCVDSSINGLQYGEQVDEINVTNPGTAIDFPGCLPGRNIRVVGGTAELPLRPAPDLLAASMGDFDATQAQGLYIPSQGLIKYLNEGDFDGLDMNFRESERAWNRGASQQDLKELKEAYVDIEVLDSRLWMRLGLQQIVWGKTELFRTTDQFNPVDLALASIPSLEESRIALISGRFIYSLYEVGPLEDVRLEFAFNFDQVQPADLGACGEPYTLDLVCSLSFGTFAHSYLGLGVAGVDRPASPWDDLGGLEIGGRIEWRWDRFSFAMTDFYGYDDIPSIESIMTFERNVDIDTGRPLVTRLNPENNRGTCAASGLAQVDANYLTATGSTNPYSNVSESRRPDATTVNGIGADLDCLKFGRAFANDPQNALEFHHANQQLFAWVCSVTIGIAAALDAGACASTLFGSPAILNPLDIPFSELITTLVAGEYQANNYLTTIGGAVSSAGALGEKTPTQGLNRDANDGIIGALTGTTMRCFVGPFEVGLDQMCGGGANANGGINQLSTNSAGAPAGNLVAKLLPSATDFITLDSGLTDEQRAMLGCGPFWGTRCDSAASMRDFDCDDFNAIPNPMAPPDSPFLANTGCQNQNGNLFVSGFGGGLVIPTSGYEFRDRLWSQIFPASVERGGGIDLLNMEGSAMVQAWGGVEGTPQGYIATSMAQAPGTVNFSGGPICTRYVPGEATPRKLPGCRGIDSYVLPDDPDDGTPIFFTFDAGYDPTVDGCLLAPMIGNHQVRTLDSDGIDFTGSVEMMSCFGQLAPTSGDFDPTHPLATPANTLQDSELNPCAPFLVRGQPGADITTCKSEIARFLDKSNSDSSRGNYEDSARGAAYLRNRNNGVDPAGDPFYTRIRGASTIYHPLAGCLTGDENSGEIAFVNRFVREGAICNIRPRFPQNEIDDQTFRNINSTFVSREDGGLLYSQATLDQFGHAQIPRDYDAEFLRGTAQIFQNELAVVSWNFGMFLVVASGCDEQSETDSNPECFNTKKPYALDRCSFNKMYLCSAIKGILGLAGVTRNVVKAGGNGQFGRRTLLWHGGQEVVLKYNKRNVFGFSADFSEDNTKSNWGVEFTWFESIPLANNNEFDGSKSVDTLNLTVSVDRPTFINFLNANRTFFFNSQWFFRYVAGHTHGHAGDEWDVLFTFAMFTGYFQDRLNPSLVTIYDFNSKSGGVLTSINYRFTEAFSATMGISLFFGETELNDMSVNPIGPPQNRAGPNAYKNGGDRFIANLRKRDEAWLRLRWTF